MDSFRGTWRNLLVATVPTAALEAHPPDLLAGLVAREAGRQGRIVGWLDSSAAIGIHFESAGFDLAVTIDIEPIH